MWGAKVVCSVNPTSIHSDIGPVCLALDLPLGTIAYPETESRQQFTKERVNPSPHTPPNSVSLSSMRQAFLVLQAYLAVS